MIYLDLDSRSLNGPVCATQFLKLIHTILQISKASILLKPLLFKWLRSSVHCYIVVEWKLDILFRQITIFIKVCMHGLCFWPSDPLTDKF